MCRERLPNRKTHLAPAFGQGVSRIKQTTSSSSRTSKSKLQMLVEMSNSMTIQKKSKMSKSPSRNKGTWCTLAIKISILFWTLCWELKSRLMQLLIFLYCTSRTKTTKSSVNMKLRLIELTLLIWLKLVLSLIMHRKFSRQSGKPPVSLKNNTQSRWAQNKSYVIYSTRISDL